MKQMLPAGTVTYQENCHITIDLLFATPELANEVVKCDTETVFDCDSDHLPILTSLKLATIEFTPEARRNFNRLDLDRLREMVKTALGTEKCLSQQEFHGRLTNEEIDSQLVAIINALQTAIAQFIPLMRISPRFKPGFTPECKEAQRECKRLKRWWRSESTEEA